MDCDGLQTLMEHVDEVQSGCTQCGLCLEHCPSYQTTGWEHESPRGKIRLAKDLLAGRISPSSAALEPFACAEGCGACEKPCPAHVRLRDLHKGVQKLLQAIQPD